MDNTIQTPTSDPQHTATLFKVFGKIGILSFGGPAAQIALMHRVLVEEKSWLNEKQYLNALSFCMLLPGPEAMQLATYAGWRLKGVLGGLIAGLLFVLPGAAIILGLALAYAYLGTIQWVQAAFLGVKAVVLIIVIEALMKVAKRALIEPLHWVLAGAAFVAIFFLNLPFPLIIILAALIGFLSAKPGEPSTPSARAPKISPVQTLKTVFGWLILWFAPLVLLYVIGADEILTTLALFFSKLAVVTFGGAYAVLAYMAQDIVNQFGWLSAGEMMDALGLAETTPGPLILVTEFVGFLAAFKENGLLIGLLGAVITLWMTFCPCFLWIFAGAPYIDWISSRPRLSGALTGITAAVVGVILNLSIWFALHVLFQEVSHKEIGIFTLWIPAVQSIDFTVLGLALLSGVALLKFKYAIPLVLGLAAGLSLALNLFIP